MEYLFSNLAFFFIFMTVLYRIFFYRNPKSPPTPFALPIIGHLYLLNKSLPLPLALDTLLSNFGPILSLKFGCRPVLVISSPCAVGECFTKNDVVFANRPKSMSGDHFTYNYLTYVWASYGDIWRTLRRLTVAEMFSSKSLQTTSSIREEEVLRLLRRLYKISSSDHKQKVDLKYLFSILVCNTVMRVTVGKPCVEEKDEDTEVERHLFQQFKDRFFPVLALNICDFFPILRMIGFGGIEKRMIKMQRFRDEYLQNLLSEIRSKRGNSKISESKERKSMVETLLALQQLEPDYYTDEVIKSIMLMMFIAGVDTSVATLEWAMSLLLNHPRAMFKLKSEIEKCVGNERLLNELDLVKLPYLRCVVNETLRMYPPGPLLLPHLSSDTCTVGGFEIQKGTTLLVNAWRMQRDPNIWEDPDEFKPERFEGELGEQIGSKYIPFGAGRRACPGNGMAIRIVSLALGALVQCFNWETDELDMSPNFGVSLSKAEPLCALCSPNPQTFPMLMPE